MSTPKSWDDYLSAVGDEAASAVKKAALGRIRGVRAAEKELRLRGVGEPWTDWTLADVDRVRESQPEKFQALCQNEGFAKRVQKLEGELSEVLQDMRKAYNRALGAAVMSPSPEGAILKRHEAERKTFILQAGVEIEKAAPGVQAAYQDLLARQKEEANELGSKKSG